MDQQSDKTDQWKKWFRLRLRSKLLVIFVLTKVLPLTLIALIAWSSAQNLGDEVLVRTEDLADQMRSGIGAAEDLAVKDSVAALDDRAREAIEARTTDIALQVADFLYDRDSDVLIAAALPRTSSAFRSFVDQKVRFIPVEPDWQLNEAGDAWEPVGREEGGSATPDVVPGSPDNASSFNYRGEEHALERLRKPLYREITFFDLSGKEIIKEQPGVTPGKGATAGKSDLRDISDRQETWWKAETYFDAIQDLKQGEIWVSDVIGLQVTAPLIGPYTKARTDAKGLPFEPEKAGFAGKENPLGKRFEGLVRWVTPVFEGDRKIGYVSLALDHAHLMAFTDHVKPTDDRYTPIPDPGSGNYGFMWDYRGRSISHPRDYFIPGYDPETGLPAASWLAADDWEAWQASGLDFAAFTATLEPFGNQSLQRRPALEQIPAGQVGLDCRWLAFAPQCVGWRNLTQHGQSGSFKIFWSGLWKLVTAAAIPYHTGPYADRATGFGFITLGANVDDFHAPAVKSAERLEVVLSEQEEILVAKQEGIESAILASLRNTWTELTASTIVMIAIVVAIALVLASALTRPVNTVIDQLRRFREGHLHERLEPAGNDELGELVTSLNQMADRLELVLAEHAKAREDAESATRAKSNFLANMSHELRTPLNAIIGFAEMISMFPDKDKVTEYGLHIHNSGKHLLEVINDILDLARVEAGKQDLSETTFGVAAALEEVRPWLAGQAAAGGVQLDIAHVRSRLALKADNRLFRQILTNLIGNAIKFTERGGAVTVTVVVGTDIRGLEPVADGFSGLQILVKDSGIGMTPEQVETALTPFGQVDSDLSRKFEGTGLGLPLARSLAALHDGEISIDSEIGVGTLVTLSIPPERVVLLENLTGLETV
ncbi:MAG: sensor histidine kinase [Magnetovibrionaceae bacterium]